MNRFEGEIVQVQSDESISLVSIAVDDIIFKTVLLETPESATYLQSGKKVTVLFKETEVIIGKGNNLNVSIQNRIQGEIHEIREGLLLSRLTLRTKIGELNAVITTDSVRKLALKQSDVVTAMIKTNEIMISTN